MVQIGGYAGKLLRVDLTKKKATATPLSKNLMKDYIGGSGFCVRILYDETGPKTDPLGPENRIIIATGPLTGTLWPSSARVNVASKSPLTGIWGETNAGGHFSPKLKYAGYDALVIQGRAKELTYLWIDDDLVEFRDATHLKGKTTWETEDIIKEDLKDESIEIASIGQAGENLVKFACIINTLSRAWGRTGIGAVMGSKNLKAIAVNGSKPIGVSDPDKFLQLRKEIMRRIEEDPFVPNIKKYGTTGLVEVMNEIGRFPTKNFQTGVFPEAGKISGDAIVEKYKISDKACHACPIACKNFLAIKTGSYAGLSGEHPEYESIDSFGARCWNADLESILYANWLCSQYGLDTISTGAVIAFIMELWEKGIIDAKDTDGLDFSWGNKETIIEMVKKIANREGFGNTLADGVKIASKKIGRGSEKYAMHVKGMEIAAQDGRAQKSMAIAHATSVRGADHLRHCTFLDESPGMANVIEQRFGSQYLPEMSDRLAVKYKGILAKGCEDIATIINSLPICTSGGPFWPPVMWWKELVAVYNTVTGMDVTIDDFKKTAERILNLKRAYNIRLGLTRSDDYLPERFLKEPAPDGPCKGHVVDIKRLVDDYYKERCWDLKTGLIPKEKLESLGLKKAANELQRIGKLPK